MDNFVLTYSVNVYVPASSKEMAIKKADAMLASMGSEKVTSDLEAIQ